MAAKKRADRIREIHDAHLDSIYHSTVFRALNHLIDEKARDLRGTMGAIKSQLDNISHGNAGISVRVSYEEDGDKEFKLPSYPIHYKRIVPWTAEVVQLEDDIQKLQRFKLQLLNDYDFTHGDDSLQREVFGSGCPCDDCAEMRVRIANEIKEVEAEDAKNAAQRK